MLTPPNPYPNPSSYEDVLKQMTHRMQQSEVDQQILAILQQAFEKELGYIILSRPERTRLFQDVSKSIFTDVLGKIGGAK